MFKLSIGSIQVVIERGFAGIACGHRQLWWSSLDGWNFESVPEGVSAGF